MSWAMSRVRAFSSFTALIERFIGLQKYSIAPRASYSVAHLEGLFSESPESRHESLQNGAGVWGQGRDRSPLPGQLGFASRGPAKTLYF